ncbi:MAG: nucleotidyltransferase family protein [Bacilli bacterium]|nr:nucleotidyltransferase family protein [Bacilli bacterium]
MVDKLNGGNLPIKEQLDILENILRLNTKLISILEILEQDGIKNYYVGAGAINQTIFNYYHGFEIDYGIKDYDIVYYDEDVSYEKEDIIIKRLGKELDKLDICYDIKNQARVHIWYYEKYGIKRIPYTSVEDAIASWGATITCVGVRLENSKLVVCAPYGLNDIFNMVIRPVKREFSKELYDERAERWMKKWSKLKKQEW